LGYIKLVKYETIGYDYVTLTTRLVM